MNAESAGGDALLDDVYRQFVHLVLYARRGAGTWSDTDELSSFVVHLGDPVVVCINEEAHGYLQAHAVRSLKNGERLEFTDVEARQVERPTDLNPPFFAADLTATGWQVRFNFNSRHPRAVEFLDTGDEFFAVAETALEAGHLRAFLENAFHSAESYARAELLSYPVAAEEIEESKKHTHVQSAYDLWARLQNTEERFPALLRQLHDARRTATYAAGGFAADPDTATGQLSTLRALRGAAHAAVAGDGRRQIRVIATRAIEAGTMITANDGTIRPRRR